MAAARSSRFLKTGRIVTMRAPPVLLCLAFKETMPSRKLICAQSRRLTSSGRIPAYSISPIAARHAPLAYSAAAVSNRCISSRDSTGMGFSCNLGRSTYATGFSRHQPRFTAVPKTPLSTNRALCLCLRVPNDFSSQARHSWGVMKRTGLRAISGQHLSRRRLI